MRGSVSGTSLAMPSAVAGEFQKTHGHARNDCDPIHVDDVNHTVTWKGNSDLSGPAGEVIRVKFYLKGAELYATQFVE